MTVPDADRPSVVVFVMAGQQRSLDALTQAVVIVSASDAAEAAEGGNATITVTYAEAQLVVGQAEAAMGLLDQIADDRVPAWRLNAARGEALVQLGRWAQAIEPLTRALRLNPGPADTHYLLARAYQEADRLADAAAHYRAAFEHTAEGRAIASHLAEKWPSAVRSERHLGQLRESG